MIGHEIVSSFRDVIIGAQQIASSIWDRNEFVVQYFPLLARSLFLALTAFAYFLSLKSEVCFSMGFKSKILSLRRALFKKNGLDWEEVVTRCREDRDLATKVDGSGNTPLHLLLAGKSFPPVEALEQLAGLCPEALLVRNNRGLSPLHMACDHNVDVLKAMLRKMTSETKASLITAGKDDRLPMSAADYNGSPLHYACFLIKINHVTALLDVFPDMAVQLDSEGQTPLALLWNHIQYTFSWSLDMSAYPIGDNKEKDGPGDDFERIVLTPFVPMDPTDDEWKSFSSVNHRRGIKSMDAAWKTWLELVRHSARSAQDRQATEYYELHQTIMALPHHKWKYSPVNAIRFVLYMHPDQASKRDKEGNTPLHLVSQMKLDGKNALYCDGNIGEEDERSLYEKLVRELISLNPAALSSPNKSGKLPLSLMMESGIPWSCGVKHAVESYPIALIRDDTIDRDVLCEVLSKVGRDCGGDTLFLVIKEKPELAGYLSRARM